MKNLVVCAFVALSVIISSPAFSEERNSQKPDHEARRVEKFTAYKKQMLSNLSEEKAAIDEMVGCVNSTQNAESIDKCREIRQAAMQRIQERNRAHRKEQLQNELKKLEEEDNNFKTKR